MCQMKSVSADCCASDRIADATSTTSAEMAGSRLTSGAPANALPDSEAVSSMLDLSRYTPVMRATYAVFRASLFVGLLLFATAAPNDANAQALKGKYTALTQAPPPHSADVVVVEEFLNFNCPHCNSFREAAKPVFAKYGKRLKLVRVPILFRGQIDAPLRLFYIAQAHGKEEIIDQALFEAAFQYGVNVFDPQVVSYLARTNDLQQPYEKDAAAEWVTRRIADGHVRADGFGIDATPSLVLQGSLRLVPDSSMGDFVANFDQLVAQLLK
jgi:protein-disulfide isomerase